MSKSTKEEKKPSRSKEKTSSSSTTKEKKKKESSKEKSSSSSSKKGGSSSSSSTKKVKKERKERKEEPLVVPDNLSPSETLKFEYNHYKSKHKETDIQWILINEEEFQIILRFGDDDDCKFSVTYPEGYPKGNENFFVMGENDSLSDWSDKMVEICDKKLSFYELLSKCAKTYKSSKLKEAIKSAHGGYDMEEDGFEFKNEKDEKPFDQVEQEFAQKKFLEIGSPTASLRLLKDLKNIKRGDPKVLGFTANPRIEPGKQLENLYHWEVRLKFDGELGKDLEKSKSSTGMDYVELEMRFSKDYPFVPPFVRVVRPRFQFRTGHVTLGGSICMELLTNSGWRSTNDIESILIQIRAEMQEGGARIQLGSAGSYNESEAWQAFYRAAQSHNWDTKGLNAQMFPKV